MPSALHRLFARLWAWRAARAWLLLLCAVILLGLAVPFLPLDNSIAISLGQKFALPSSEHWLGTDQLGRDIFSRLLWGIRTSVFTALLTMLLIAIVGTAYGITAAMSRGRTGNLMMRFADVMMSFPSEVTVLALVGIMGPGVFSIVLASVVAMWPWYARMARTIVKGLLSKGYVEAARVSGISRWQLVKDHILPGALGEFFVLMSLDAGHILLLISTLSFLGLGLQPPTPEWGMMLAESKEVMSVHAWLSWIPGLAILFVVATLSFLGDALRDALDTRVQKGFSHWENKRAGDSLPPQSLDKGEASVPVLPQGLTVRRFSIALEDKGGARYELVTHAALAVTRGEALVILGESGAGKTLLSRALVGLLPAKFQVTGEVWLDGETIFRETVDHRAASRGAKLLYIVQNAMTAFEPLAKVGKQLDAVLSLRLKEKGEVMSAEARRQKIVDVLTRLRFTEPERVLSAYPAEISGGMAQRALLATVLLREPSVAIIDEPTASLDAESTREVIETLVSLKTSGMTLLVITHDLTLAERLADQLIVMQNGRVIESGAGALLKHPADPYTRALVHSHQQKEKALDRLLSEVSQKGVGASAAHDLLHREGKEHHHLASDVREQGYDEAGLLAHLEEEIAHHQMHHAEHSHGHHHHDHDHVHVHVHEHSHAHEHLHTHSHGHDHEHKHEEAK